MTSCRYVLLFLAAWLLPGWVSAQEPSSFYLKLKHDSQIIGPFSYARGSNLEFQGAGYSISKMAKRDGRDYFEIASVKTKKTYGPFQFALGKEVRLGPFAFEIADHLVQIIRIDLPGNEVLSLAEVQVFSGGQNVALKKLAHASSNEGAAHAKKATDGGTDGVYSRGSVTHTKPGEKDSWWYLDLQQPYAIERIVIWNRTDCCQTRLNGFVLKLMDKDKNVLWETTRPDASADAFTIKPFQ